MAKSTAEVNHSYHYSGVPEVEILESWTNAEINFVFIPTSNITTEAALLGPQFVATAPPTLEEAALSGPQF